MRTLALVLLAALTAACGLERHADTDGIADNDCYACHRANYEQASDPVHVGAKPTTCRDCHSQIAWRPAGPHPDADFPIRTGPHAAVDCGACHKPALGPPTDGANTDCLTCHTEAATAPAHVGESDYRWDPAFPHSCLTCHPMGLANKHPEDRFPITRGPHQMPCADCHIRANGPNTAGMNTTCIGCHTGEHALTRADRQHDEVNRYGQYRDPNKPHFCLECHPDGRH